MHKKYIYCHKYETKLLLISTHSRKIGRSQSLFTGHSIKGDCNVNVHFAVNTPVMRMLHTSGLRYWHRYTWEISELLSYTALCYGIVSHMGLNLGPLDFCRPHKNKSKSKTNTPTIFAHQTAFYMCLSLCSARSRCLWQTYVTNNSYFDYGKNSKTPKLSLMSGKNDTDGRFSPV